MRFTRLELPDTIIWAGKPPKNTEAAISAAKALLEDIGRAEAYALGGLAPLSEEGTALLCAEVLNTLEAARDVLPDGTARKIVCLAASAYWDGRCVIMSSACEEVKDYFRIQSCAACTTWGAIVKTLGQLLP